MAATIVDQTVDFYYDLFREVFAVRLADSIPDRLKRDAVIRQVQESAAAASQSLTRFFVSNRLSKQKVAEILKGFSSLGEKLTLDRVANPTLTPESMVDALLTDFPCPQLLQDKESAAAYRVSLHSTVQVLMLVGPVMEEWRKLGFSSTFELPRRVVNRLNEISQQVAGLSPSGQAAADEDFELTYRDYLLQRFYRVEAGTVRMTTNLAVDLRELFVMPRVDVNARIKGQTVNKSSDPAKPLDVAAARAMFGPTHAKAVDLKKIVGIRLLDQVKKYRLNVIIGPPGSGKSTFLEWLQLKLAGVEEELVLAGKQAIPLLLRVRELDVYNLPCGAGLIERAMASRDRATLMPDGWVDRQMEQGRVLFMLDGLDEAEPALRDKYLLPWLIELRRRYPTCHCLISSRPVGYPPGTLQSLEFAECMLLDFQEPEMNEYTRHWCTAIRLARNEPEEEARREGAKDGQSIVDGFKNNPFITSLARNPLMLSAICLVNFFEGGELPQDRALLYRLCVEGLLHHWDQRRGIRSEFGLEEKLRVCREVALKMHVDDRAEYETGKVLSVFSESLGDAGRAQKLMEHIQYRSGLLVERRPGMFAFAHLTFQEYLAALAVHIGNRFRFTAKQLADSHGDGRWNEVIALYCRVSPLAAALEIVSRLMDQPYTRHLSQVLAEAYLSAGNELARDKALRKRVLERIALLPGNRPSVLNRFPTLEVMSLANRCLGKIKSNLSLSEAYMWMLDNPPHFDAARQVGPLRSWRSFDPYQLAELVVLMHQLAPVRILEKIGGSQALYRSPGPKFQSATYPIQAEIALVGLSQRELRTPDSILISVFGVLSDPKVEIRWHIYPGMMPKNLRSFVPQDHATARKLRFLAQRFRNRLLGRRDPDLESLRAWLDLWISQLTQVSVSRSTKKREKRRTAVQRL